MGLIVAVIGLLTIPSGQVAALLGGILAAGGGVGASITYNNIQHNKSINASQAGKGNSQVNQTSPVGSPAIGRARDVYIGTSPPSRAPEPEKKTPPPSVVGTGKRKRLEESDAQVEWLWTGDIHVNKHQEFEAPVKRGDKISWQLESKDPIALTILSRNDAATFLDIIDGEVPSDEEYTFYYRTPVFTTNSDFPWVSTVNGTVMVVITGGKMDYEEKNFSTQVSAKIKIVRKAMES